MRPSLRIETFLLPLLLIAIAAPIALPASAAVESGVEFDEVAVVDSSSREPTRLELCSTGVLRYKRIFRGYAAALYREECSASDTDLTEVPLRLELAYYWSIDGNRFGEAAEKLLRKSLTPEAFEAIESRMHRLHAAYESVSPGDRYALTWTPGVGTVLALNGRTLAMVEGEDFARAYFDLWLGDEPMDERLRNALLAPNDRD